MSGALPNRMKAVAFTAPERAELLDWDTDASPLKPDEVAGRTLASLVSPGTELNFAYTGIDPTYTHLKYPMLSGYAAVMEIDAVGEAVTEFRAGDRALVMGPHASRQRTSASGAIPVPAGLLPRVAVFARLMGVSWTTLVTTTARPADRVLVTGLGPVGNLAAQIFESAGYRVTACDPVEPRRRIAERCDLTDVQPAVPGDVPGGFALALECSGHEAAALDCCRAVRKRGEVALVGVPWKKRTDLPAFDLLHAVFHRYVVLRSGWEWELPVHERDFAAGSIHGNLFSALAWLNAGRVRVEGLADAARPSDAQAVYQNLLHRRTDALSTVFEWTAEHL